jgi:hypothetical protein
MDQARIHCLNKGLTNLGSAYGSVRCQDGICQINDLYLAAHRWCERFEPHLGAVRK